MKKLKVVVGFFLAAWVIATEVVAQDAEEVYQDFRVELNADYRYFFQEGLYPGQERSYLSFAVKPEYVREWLDGKYTFKFVGFARVDQHDKRRTHFDIRELYWQVVQDNAEVSIGIKKVFWGVTESAHLVDIINQTDVVESFDGEEKLGQPMVHYSYLTGFGTLDFFLLPYFRRPAFPGEKGRLRTPIVLDSREFEFQSSAEEYRPDLAVRYSTFFGVFDAGLSYFYGTGRDPIVTSIEEFRPIYGVIHQVGLDLQATTGPALWKLEAIRRMNDLQDMVAIVGGVEYTFGNIGGSGIDWGILGEYLYDNRGTLALNSLQNDVFVGSRIGFNDTQDTQILMGAIVDLEYSTRIYSIEADRRIGESWTTEVEARIFSKVSDSEFIYFFREDSFLKFSLSKYF